jgi:hypothetical protein
MLPRPKVNQSILHALFAPGLAINGLSLLLLLYWLIALLFPHPLMAHIDGWQAVINTSAMIIVLMCLGLLLPIRALKNSPKSWSQIIPFLVLTYSMPFGLLLLDSIRYFG